MNYNQLTMENTMEGFKSIFTSKTFWGVVISIISKALLYFGFEVTESIEKELTDLIIAATGFIGDGVAIVGRVKATKKIS